MADGVSVNGVGARRAAARAAPSSWADRHIAWLLALPAVLLILALSIYPLLYSVWVAFVNYDFEIPGHAFVGLENFRDDGERSDRPPLARQHRDPRGLRASRSSSRSA